MNHLRYDSKLDEVLCNIALSVNNDEEFCHLDFATKITLLVSICDDIPYDYNKSASKDRGRANTLKIHGNRCFQDGDNLNAVTNYNEAIKICPQNDLEGKKLYAVLIANRSAVFFADGEYQKVLQDIAFLKQNGNHPNPEKIKSRETKAHEALRQRTEAAGADVVECEELTWTSKNIIYPALSSKLTIKTNAIMGRHVVATEDIETGEIVGVEKPYISIMRLKRNCGYCGLSSNQTYACPGCPTVYCSEHCSVNAKVFHQYECAILLCLYDLPSYRLPFKMITHRSLQQVIKDEAHASEERKIDQANVYKTNDYYNASRLVRHKDDEAENIIFAAFFLKLLRNTEYFGASVTNSLSKDEIFVGELLLKYLGIGKCNSHAVYVMNDSGEYQGVGSGIYPTLALFNHSCAPSVENFNINDHNFMVVRSIKPIKAGDIVYNNYGTKFIAHKKKERMEKMTEHYRFTCTCQACVEDWPDMMDMMCSKRLRVLCDCGEIISINSSTGILKPSAICRTCRKKKNLRSVQKTLTQLEKQTKDADDLHSAGNFEDARKMYVDIIDSQFKYFVPPCLNIINVQDKLIKLFQLCGNKKWIGSNYKFGANKLDTLMNMMKLWKN